MFSLAHCAVCLAPAEDAFGHFAAGLGDLADGGGSRASIALLRRLPVLVRLSFCATCGVTFIRRSRNVIAGVVCFVLADGDAL